MPSDLNLRYSIRCRNCRYSREWGSAPLTACVKATSHAYRLGHIVDVLETDLTRLESVIYETCGNTTEKEIPF